MGSSERRKRFVLFFVKVVSRGGSLCFMDAGGDGEPVTKRAREKETLEERAARGDAEAQYELGKKLWRTGDPRAQPRG